jgi:hypothetical protein
VPKAVMSCVRTWIVKLRQTLLQHIAQLAVQLTEVRLKQSLVKDLRGRVLGVLRCDWSDCVSVCARASWCGHSEGGRGDQNSMQGR